MARNKYPEETVQKILEVATRLFIGKGYEDTTIGDIVDGLGGMTRGAVYHHFKSKDEILDAVTQQMYSDTNPFSWARENFKTGRQQLTMALRQAVSESPDTDHMKLNRQMVSLLKEPRFLAEHLSDTMKLAQREVLPMIDRGNADGTLSVAQPQQAAETLMMLMNFGLVYSNGTLTRQEFEDRLQFAKRVLDDIGLDVLDEETIGLIKQNFGNLFEEEENPA